MFRNFEFSTIRTATPGRENQVDSRWRAPGWRWRYVYRARRAGSGGPTGTPGAEEVRATEDGCACSACRAFWPPQEFHWLARLLACAELPARSGRATGSATASRFPRPPPVSPDVCWCRKVLVCCVYGVGEWTPGYTGKHGAYLSEVHRQRDVEAAGRAASDRRTALTTSD